MKVPQIIAHRGARRLALENTLDAFHAAWEEGADGVEFDIQQTADGELIVLHDGDLFAQTGDPRPVWRWRWRELRTLRLRDAQGRRGVIPHLDEVIEALQGRAGLINAELKLAKGGPSPEKLGRAFARRTRSLDLQGWCVSSFSSELLAAFVDAGGATPVAALFSADDGTHRGLQGPSALQIEKTLEAARGEIGRSLAAVHPQEILVDAEVLAVWREAGLKVRAWTVNEPRRVFELARLGVDAIVTDDPGALRRFFLWSFAEIDERGVAYPDRLIED